MQCLNVKNKEVAALLEEYTNILGNENAAYYVLSENNGYGLDKAPNGADSKLFSDLLNHYNGDRNKAILAKSRVYSDSFRNWFGNWLSDDKTDVSKVVDENGEPLVVYHHANNEISEFSVEFNNYFSTQKGGTKKALFFTGTREPKKGTVLDRPFRYPVYLNAKTTIEKTGTKDELKESGEDFVTTINRAAEEVDAAIFYGIDDNQELNQNIYVINNPNNVKSIDNQGTFSTSDNNIYLSSSNNSNVLQLDRMSQYPDSKSAINSMLNSEDKQVKKLATILNDVMSKVNASPVSIQYSDVPLNEIYPEATYWTPAIYDRTTNTIVVNKNGDFSRYGSLENVLLHEIVHALTIESLSSDLKSAKELQTIFEEYKKHNNDYASTNVYEFAAELFSNPELIRNMQTFSDPRSKKTLLQKLLDWFKKLFNKNTKHQELIDLITDNIIEFNAYKTLENLENSDDFVPKTFQAATTRQEIVYDKIKNIFSDINKTAFNRSGSLKYNIVDKVFDKNETLRTEKLLTKLNNISRTITDEVTAENIAAFLNGTVEYADSVLQSITEAEKVLNKISSKLEEAHSINNQSDIAKYRTILDNFGAEYLDPHKFNLKKIYDELQSEFNRNVYISILGESYFDQIVNLVSGLITELSETKMLTKNNIGYNYNNIVRKTIEKFLREEMTSAKDPSVDNALKNWLSFDGDISSFNKQFGLLTNSSIPILKVLRKVIGEANAETHRQVYNKYAEIQKDVSNVSNVLDIAERDENGNFTGYITRDRRYGVYQNNKYKWRKKWLKDHKVASVDELRLIQELWSQYQREYNNWKSKNAERRFTPEFYELFINLSPEANMALSEINLEIENMLKPFIDEVTKKPRFEEMTEDEYELYLRLLEKKRNLANPYDPITGELKPKGSTEYNIAVELSEVNKKLKEGLQSEVNMSAFIKEMNQMKSMQGYTPDGKYTIYEAWLDRNTRWDFTDEFKTLLSKQNKLDYGEIYDRLYQARYNLLKLYTTDKNEPDSNRIPEAVKAKIRELDIAMYSIRAKGLPGIEIDMGHKKLFKTEFTSVVKKNGGKESLTDDDFWIDPKGKVHYYSYLLKIVPINEKYLHRVPNNNWAETSKESAYYNKNYDPTIPEAEQPKLSIKEYDNRKEFSRISKDAKLMKFRQTFIDTMDEANSKLTHTNYKNNYKLPQVTGNIFNYIGAKGVVTGIRDYMLDAFTILPDDELHGVKVENRPNGTEINILPTMYTTMLNNPSVMSHDLVDSLMRYYRMACNYDNKKKVSQQLNLLDRLVSKEGVIKEGDSATSAEGSNLAKTVHEYIGYHLYGRSSTLPKIKIFNREISLDKIFRIFAQWGRDIGLAWNLRSQISGLVSATLFYRNDATISRNFNMRNFRAAEWILTKELSTLRLLTQLGKNISTSKMLGVLEYNGLTFNLESEFKHTNRWRIGRTITNVVHPYAGFKMASLLPNTIFSISTYLNYKLMKLEDGNLHFVSENDFLNNHFPNLSIEEKKALYNIEEQNLWDAYHMNGNRFEVKPEYKQYISKELENEISSKLTHISSHAEGMVEEADKSGIYFNTALSTILMFRAFMPKNIENTLSNLHWNYQTKEMMLGTLSAYYLGWKIGADNFISKMLGMLLSNDKKNENLKKYQELYPGVDIKSEVKRYVHRFHAQMFSYLFFLVLSNLLSGVDDDDELTSLFKLEINKISLELGSRYNANDIFSILNSLTPLIKTTEDMWNAFSPIAYFDENKYKKVKRGAYKGWYGWQRDLFKVIPITNAYFNMKNPSEKLKDFENRIN